MSTITQEYNRLLKIIEERKRDSIVTLSIAIKKLESGDVSEAHSELVAFLDKVINQRV